MSLKRKTFGGLFWAFSQDFGTTGIRFVIQIFLARLIVPEQFGLFGMIGVFYAIAESLTNTGMGTSLIRLKNPTHEDYSTVFWENIMISAFIYISIFLAAPYIADFYKQDVISSLIRVYGLNIVLSALYGIHVTKQTKELNFRRQTIITLPSLLISSILGIYLGYLNYGVWALVYMQLAQTLILGLQYWIRAEWTPGFIFDSKIWKFHFNFGYKFLLSSVVNNIFINLYPMIIGKFHSPKDVGFYSRALSLRNLPLTMIARTFAKVTYPILVEVREDEEKLIIIFRKFVKTILLVSGFAMFLLLVIAKPLVIVLITETWLPAVPYLQIICISAVFVPLQSYYVNIFNIYGRSETLLYSLLCSRVLNLVIIFITVQYGIIAIVIGQVIAEIVNSIITQLFGLKFIKYTIMQQFSDIVRVLLPSMLVSGLVYFIFVLYEASISNHILQAFINLFLFVILFIPIQFLINKNILLELLNMKNLIIKRSK